MTITSCHYNAIVTKITNSHYNYKLSLTLSLKIKMPLQWPLQTIRRLIKRENLLVSAQFY
jgi:hypothetical protein